MRLSEFISRLSRIRDREGDLEVTIGRFDQRVTMIDIIDKNTSEVIERTLSDDHDDLRAPARRPSR